MYASTVWMNDQQHIFKDLLARVLLKLTGSEYYTQKDLTELMLNIPPINLQFEQNAVKFLLKGLTSDDDMIATILHIEQEPKHPYYRLITLLKSYLHWKEGTVSNNKVIGRSRNSTRSVDLCNFMNHKHCYYQLLHERRDEAFPKS